MRIFHTGVAGYLGSAIVAELDLPVSSAQTQERLGWCPTGPGLIADLAQMRLHRSILPWS